MGHLPPLLLPLGKFCVASTGHRAAGRGLAGAESGQVIGFRGQPPSPLTRAVFPKQNI